MSIATRPASPRRVPTARSLALAALAAVPLLAGGCVFEQARFRQTTNVSAPHVAGSGLRVTARNGAIDIRKAATPDGKVEIAATLLMVTQERLGEATIQANRDSAGVLEIEAKPPSDGWRSGEGCSFDIAIPDAVGVELKSGNGHLRIEGLAGKATLETSNGAITVVGHNGDLDARTSNGRVEASDVSGAIVAHTSNGHVTISMAPGSYWEFRGAQVTPLP